MATELRLDPELAAVVDRARRRAGEMGELPRRQVEGPITSPLSPHAQQILREWLDSGDFDAAIAEIGAEDPDLATQ